MGWRGDLPKAGVDGNFPGVVEWRGDLSKAGMEGNVPGVVDVEGRSSKAGVKGEFFQKLGWREMSQE